MTTTPLLYIICIPPTLLSYIINVRSEARRARPALRGDGCQVPSVHYDSPGVVSTFHLLGIYGVTPLLHVNALLPSPSPLY